MLPQQVATDLFVSRCAMSRAFNAVMRVISSLIGVVMVLMGAIWILQGLNLAWGSLSRSFMQGDQHWVFYGRNQINFSFREPHALQSCPGLDQGTTLSTMKVTELQNCGGNPTR